MTLLILFKTIILIISNVLIVLAILLGIHTKIILLIYIFLTIPIIFFTRYLVFLLIRRESFPVVIYALFAPLLKIIKRLLTPFTLNLIIALIISLFISGISFQTSQLISNYFNVSSNTVAPSIVAGVFAIIIAILQLRPNVKQKEKELDFEQQKLDFVVFDKQKNLLELELKFLQDKKRDAEGKRDFLAKILRLIVELESSSETELIKNIQSKKEIMLDYFEKSITFNLNRDIIQQIESIVKTVNPLDESKLFSPSEFYFQSNNLLKILKERISRELQKVIDECNTLETRIENIHNDFKEKMSALKYLNSIQKKLPKSP